MKYLFLILVLPLFLAAQEDSTQATYPEYPYPELETYIASKYEWTGYLLPGAGYSVYVPTRKDSLGIFYGPYAQFILFQRSCESEAGPGLYQFYMRLNSSRSSEKSQRQIFSYAFGANFSFEKNPKRIAGIPYFGLEMGGLHQAKNKRGNFCITPVLGLHIIATKRVDWYVHASYNFATRSFDEWSGVYAGMGLNVQFW